MMKNKIFCLILTVFILASAIAPLGTVAATPSVTLPSLTADANCADYESDGDSKVYYYTGVAKSNFDSYISTLKNGGYSEIKTYNADSCYYSLLDNGTATLFVSFLRSASTVSKKGRLRIFVQASGTPYHTQSEAIQSNICTPKLWQLDVDNSGGEDGGMSYVVRLTDGTFVVIDGGYRTDREAQNLYSVIASNNVLNGKPVISAWFITHLHIDHYGVLSNFTELYSDSVIVKGFYYNFPSQVIGDVSGTNAAAVEATMSKWQNATLYSKIHSGMVMGFAGATVEVLATHEDVKQSYYSGTLKTLTENGFKNDGNETSTVIRFNIAGQSMMFLADAETAVGKTMLNTYTTDYLKSDIMQVAHHGFSDTVSSDLIGAINPDVALWPMDITRYVNGEITEGTTTDTKTFTCYYNRNYNYVNAIKASASEVIPAYKNEVLTLPYTANTLYSTQIPDITTLAVAKVRITNATKDIYVQKSNDGTKIRFIGVLNLSEEELEEYSNFGFDISMRYNDVTYMNRFTTTTVYTSLIANGNTVYASRYGGTYFYAVEVTGLDFTNNDVEFLLSGTGTYKSGEESVTLTYDVRRYVALLTLKSAESETMPSVSFSDILSGAWEETGAQ